jgi:acyl-CoA thioesterase FadM
MIGIVFRILNQLMLGKYAPLKMTLTPGKVVYEVPFRCYPVDMDAFMHMNNAMYARVAELARWRIFPKTDTLKFSDKGILFLVVENDITYNRPIMPFQKYIVKTTLTSTENKWLFYEHKFIQHPSQVKTGEEPKTFATVIAKAVLKEKSGKTVRISEVDSDFYRTLAAKE